MHGKLLRPRAYLRRGSAVKIHMRRKIFVSAAGVQINYTVAAAYYCFLKKRRKPLGVRSAGAAGEYPVEILAVGGKNIRAAAYEPVVVKGVDKVKLAAYILRVKTPGKLDNCLNAHIFTAVNSCRYGDAQALLRAVYHGFGIL